MSRIHETLKRAEAERQLGHPMSTAQAAEYAAVPTPSPDSESFVEPAEPETTTAQKRVNVIFSPQQYQTLRDLADKQGINISDVLRQAINITKLVVEANQDGKILIQRRNGKVQQLKLV